MVELAPLDSTLAAYRMLDGINPDALHQGHVDHQPAIADARASGAVGATAHGHQQVVVTGEVDGLDDVGHPNGAGDQAGPSVDIAIPDLAGLGIAVIAGRDE